MPNRLIRLKHEKQCEGGIRAQCPACAEDGHDSKGEHLFIFPSGQFGCAVHPGDHAHRQRIWALAGDGGKIPAYVAVCRPVVLRQKWKSSDVSDGCFRPLEVLGELLYARGASIDPSESSGKGMPMNKSTVTLTLTAAAGSTQPSVLLHAAPGRTPVSSQEQALRLLAAAGVSAADIDLT
jgi:hypothetical protein